ncbi:MAG TPA: hypothetical protein DEB05_13690 [Firmicutes bacterium]|nr:hypothetical protein [Bacillota bacterium]HBT17993.1 hypothetical protein [Bacillota bacterium]
MLYLIVGTILLVVTIFIFIIKKVHDKIKLTTLSICLFALAFSLISSYELLFQSFEADQFRPLALLNLQLIFLFNVLIKFLIFYWLVAIATGIINPERISKYGAKLLGLEVYSEYAEKAKKIEDNAEKADKQMDLIVELNRNIFDFLLKPFEENVIKAENQADMIRDLVKDILIKSYNNYPGVKIFVLPLNEKGFLRLGEELTAYVRPLSMENRPLTTIEKKTIGIGIIPGMENLSTAIIIDTTKEHYEISDAEICSAGSLFVSIATAIHWSIRCKDF